MIVTAAKALPTRRFHAGLAFSDERFPAQELAISNQQ